MGRRRGYVTEPPPAASPPDEKTTDLGEDWTPHTLSVIGLTYIIRSQPGSWWKGCCRPVHVKTILKNVSLHLQSPQVTAILGNSGSGKTTLLDVISRRHKGQAVGGIYLDGKLMTPELFRTDAGYVIQTDCLLPHLTVRETLTYTAKLKFAMATNEAIQERVDAVTSDMGLRHVTDQKVGGLVERGLSGGEKRRLSVAVQLLQDPKLLLLDEPTTGLDSFTSHHLIATLSALAKRRNKIILLSIHQPRSDIGTIFDKLGLLSMGEMVYMGPSRDLVPHFTALGYPCPTYANPLDHYIDLVSVDRRTVLGEEASRLRVKALKTAYVQSPVFRNTLMEAHHAWNLADQVQEFQMNPLGVPAPPGYFSLLGTLVTRLTVNQMRNRSSLVSRCLQLPVMAGFLVLFIVQLQLNQSSIQDRIGLFFQAVQTPPYVGLLCAISCFPTLRDMFKRESRDGLYACLVFLNAYFVHIIPYTLISAFIFSTVTYWGIGMYPDPARYGVFFTVVFLMQYSGELLAVLLMGVIDNPNTANSASALILAISGLISSGFLRTIQSMPKVIIYLSYATIFKYSAEILVANELEELVFDCGNNNTVSTEERCLFPTGEDFLNVFYPDAVQHMAQNFGIMAAFIFGYNLLAIIVYKVMGRTRL